jgi:hypothetical protein
MRASIGAHLAAHRHRAAPGHAKRGLLPVADAHRSASRARMSASIAAKSVNPSHTQSTGASTSSATLNFKPATPRPRRLPTPFGGGKAASGSSRSASHACSRKCAIAPCRAPAISGWRPMKTSSISDRVTQRASSSSRIDGDLGRLRNAVTAQHQGGRKRPGLAGEVAHGPHAHPRFLQNLAAHGVLHGLARLHEPGQQRIHPLGPAGGPARPARCRHG